MIKRLKIKFIILAISALFVMLSVIVTGMNIINYRSVISEADNVLELLSKNKGSFPEPNKGPHGALPHGMSPETPYESRYFSVRFDESGNILNTDISRIAAIDLQNAKALAKKAYAAPSDHGFLQNFRYIKTYDGGTLITFLDCGRHLNSFYSFLYASIIISALGLLAVSVIIILLAGRIIKPISESYQKQRQFITDASHEIKTPLTIINANVDLLEMEYGKNECLSDIGGQIERLKELTRSLVMLTRMEEQTEIQKIEFPLSDVVRETVRPFESVATAQNKQLVCNIEPMLSFYGNEGLISQLVSILTDNALKYSPQNSAIIFELGKRGKGVYISVYNKTASPLSPEDASRVFDRFYRGERSRNSQTGGHGIGLSVAHAIVQSHGGRINAYSRDGTDFQIYAII